MNTVIRKKPIYLDYAATTPADPVVVATMLEFLGPDSLYANPASVTHGPGRAARKVVEEARASIAELINATPDEVIFTSGATESDNLALIGAARYHQSRGRHLITTRIEHKAVLDTARALEAEGFQVTYLTPDEAGHIHPQMVEEAIRPDTILVSVMHVNNEVGVVEDIAEIGRRLEDREILFHVDAAQSVGKIPVDVDAAHVDLLSMSSHKVYGPKGMGALYVRHSPAVGLEPLIHGGGHERGLRSGTLATHQIAGMGKAFELARNRLVEDHRRIEAQAERLLAGLENLGGVHLNGCRIHRSGNIINVSFDDVAGDGLLYFLSDVAASTGSACSSANSEPSYVLRAMGCSAERARASLRLSIGRFTTDEEITSAIEHIGQAVNSLRAISGGLRRKACSRDDAA